MDRRGFLQGLMAASAAVAVEPAKGIWLPREERGVILPESQDFDDFVREAPEFDDMLASETWETGGRLAIRWTLQPRHPLTQILHGWSLRYETGSRRDLIAMGKMRAMTEIEEMISITADRIDGFRRDRSGILVRDFGREL